MKTMSPSLIKSALKLSKPEKILLVEQIWDSLAREQDAPDLSDAQKAELDRRLRRRRVVHMRFSFTAASRPVAVRARSS